MRRVRRSLLVVAVLAVSAIVPNLSQADHVHGGPDTFVTLSDGTSIAMNVVFPKSYNPARPAAKKFPTIFEFAGYENGSSSDEGRTFFGGATPSRITLPLVSLTGVRLGPALACGDYWQVRCFPD